jgi:NAD(P)-dependent dehydrogenase (short-subunit alcohol dehydrogenase family)
MSGRPGAGETPTGVALVTGAARRIGRAIALELAAAGWDVAVHYLSSAAAARETVAAIEALGRRSAALEADLADEAATAGLMARAAAALGPLTLLVNSAAVFDFDRPETAGGHSWQRHMAINARAPLLLTQGLLRQLPEGAQANVVNLIDARVWSPTPNYTSYTASKVALWGLTRHLAVALAPRVRVNAIGPGPSLAHAGADAARFARLQAAMPLGRGGSPEEIARAVRFILDQPTLTGQMIALDGGQHLGWLLPGQLAQGG